MAVNMEVKNACKSVDAQPLSADSKKLDDSVQTITKALEFGDQLSCCAATSKAEEKSSGKNVHAGIANSDFCIETNITLNTEHEVCNNGVQDHDVHDNPNDYTALKDEDKTELLKTSLEEPNSVHVAQPSLAFTIDFNDKKEVDAAKYQNLFERYNARHKRHPSISKVETNTKKSGSSLSPSLVQKQKVPSTHSEGYFSSEDDTKRKSDYLSEKFKLLGSKSFQKGHSVSRKCENMSDTGHSKEDLMTRSYDDQTKCSKLLRQNLSLELGYSSKAPHKQQWTPQKSATINDLSHIQKNNYDNGDKKLYTKNIEYVEADNKCGSEKDAEGSIVDLTEKISNIGYVSSEYSSRSTSAKKNMSSISYTMELNADDMEDANLDVFNVSTNDAGSDGGVSEAGTYTIHKDYTDEEKARMDIDKVFSVGVLTEDESNEAYVHSFKMSISRDNNTWISEWATQVAQHNSLPPAIGGGTGRTPPLSPSKIPSPIHSRSHRLSRSRYEQSDSSLDAESYMRVKERVGLTTNQHTLIDSGGESDDDTSNSYNTPPHSAQRTPVHNTVGRRSSLSESLFRRINTNENRKSARKYLSANQTKTDDGGTNSLNGPSQTVTSFHAGRRSSSLDRKEYTSDTTESNTSRRNSMKHCPENDSKHMNSPVLNRLRPSTPKLTTSPIVTRKMSTTKIVNAPMLEKTKHLAKSSPQARNIGYFTCVENSPYMLRKSNSTTNYHEGTIARGNKELSPKAGVSQKNSEFQCNSSIQRSSSNASIRNTKSKNLLSRRSSFNSSDIERTSSRGRFLVASDSSSETGEQQVKPSALPVSSGIKPNRAFSIRRARLTCESDTTPNTTPDVERRRRAQTEVKSTAPLNKQQSYHRSRTNSAGAHNKESLKKSDSPKSRTPSISRADSGRQSIRAPKTTYRAAQKSAKDHKKSARSNSTLTSKEVEFQNWKRRKSYDPMKAAAEGRRKLIDGTKKHHSTEDSTNNHDNSVLRSASFHGTGATLSLANEWSDNELDFPEDKQVPPPCSPQLESDSDLETSSYLQTTQNVMSAMSARITIYRPSLVDSDNESDEDTSQSLRQNISKVTVRQPSDTESSDERRPVAQSPLSNTKYNRAFSLRRARLESQPPKAAASNIIKSKSSHDARGKPESAMGIARTDSGRFSMRISRTSNLGSKGKTKDVKKPTAPNAREVEMQNWKRRKSYDPMKAAMEGRKKAGLAKRNANPNLSPSHVARSQSFHGSVGLGTSDWSDEDLAASADEVPLY